MFIHWPSKASVVLLCDTRTNDDCERDAECGSIPSHGASVLRFWPWGKAVWGSQWPSVARVALFNPGEKVTAEARKEAKRSLAQLLSTKQPSLIVVLQTLSKSARKVYGNDVEQEAKADHDGTIVWDFFSPPSSLSNCAGTFLSTPYGTVLPVLNPRNGDYVYGNPIGQWLQWAREGVRPEPTPPFHVTPGALMEGALERLLVTAKTGAPITVDIENFSGSDLITVLGLSDGLNTVAVPWHSFTPHGQQYVEEGHSDTELGQLARAVLREAQVVIGHNHIDHDLPLLESVGVAVPGKPFDTFLAHGVVMNQLRHGLQQCVSYFLPAPPWKELYRYAQGKRTGADKDTLEFWTQYPEELRAYNCGDSYWNHKLAEALWFPVTGRAFGEGL